MSRERVAAGCALAAIGAGAAQAATPELSVDQRLRGPARGRGGDPGAGARLPGRPVLRERLAHHGGDGRHRHAAAEAARLRRPSGSTTRGSAPATEFTQRGGLRALRVPVRRRDAARAHRRGAGRPARRAARPEGDQPEEERADRQRLRRRPLRADDAVPVGLRRARCPTRATTCRTRARSTAAGSSSATRASFRARARRTPTRRSSAPTASRGPARPGPGHYGPFGAGPRVRRRTPSRCPRSATTARSAAARAGSCTTACAFRGGGSDDAVDRRRPARRTRPARPRSEYRRADRRPGGAAGARKTGRASGSRSRTQLDLPGHQLLAGLDRVGQAEPRRPHPGRQGPRPALDRRGQGVGLEGSLDRIRWVGAGFPDYPWLFGVDGEYTAHASRDARPVRARSRTTCGRCATSPSAQRRVGRGRPRGRRRRLDLAGKDSRDARTRHGRDDVRLQHGRDRQVPGRRGADLALDGRRRASATRCSTSRAQPRVRAHASSTTTATAGRRATATSSGPAWARRSSTTPSTTSAGCTTTPTWRGRRARTAGPTRPRREARRCAPASRTRGGSRRSSSTPTRSATGDEKINQQHWIGVDPMEAELFLDGEFVPGLAAYEPARARSPRARTAATAARGPATAVCSTPAAGRAERRRGAAIFSLNTGDPGRRRGQLRPPRRRAAAALHRRERGDAVLPAGDRGHAGRAAGRDARDHAVHTPPTPTVRAPRRTSTAAGRAARCSCRRGATPAPRGRSCTSSSACGPASGAAGSRSCRRCPTAQPRASAADIRLGAGAADVPAVARGQRYTTETDTADVPGWDAPDRPHAAAGRHGGLGRLDGGRSATTVAAYRPAGSRSGSAPTRARRARGRRRRGLSPARLAGRGGGANCDFFFFFFFFFLKKKKKN